MFNSVTEALNIINELSKIGDIHNTRYIQAIKYLKSQGYVMNGVGFRNKDERWNYRSLQARIYAIRSIKNQQCNKCVDIELMKGWKIPILKEDILKEIESREQLNSYLF